MIDVCVSGAAGRMGRAVVGAVGAEPDMRVTASVDPVLAGHSDRTSRRPWRRARRT